MEKNPWSGMRTFSCKCKISVFFSKIHTIFNQIMNNFLRAADHNIHRFFPVLVMTCAHCIFKISLIILIIPKYTDSTLCQK